MVLHFRRAVRVSGRQLFISSVYREHTCSRGLSCNEIGCFTALPLSQITGSTEGPVPRQYPLLPHILPPVLSHILSIMISTRSLEKQQSFLKFSAKSQLSVFKGVQFCAQVDCLPRAKQRDEAISQPVTQHVSQYECQSAGVIFPLGSGIELLPCCHFGFHYSCLFVHE